MDIFPTFWPMDVCVQLAYKYCSLKSFVFCFVFKFLNWHSCIYWWLFNFLSFWTEEGLTVRQVGALGQKRGQGSPPSCRSLTHAGDEERKTRGTSEPGIEIKYLHQQNEHLFRSLHFHICIPNTHFCTCTTTTLPIRDGLKCEVSHGTHCQLSPVELSLSFLWIYGQFCFHVPALYL